MAITLPSEQESKIIEVYSSTDTPVSKIIEMFDICYYTLYNILYRTHTKLRAPPSETIVVLNDQGTPIRVPRTPKAVSLRDRQVQEAYYTQQELVSHITKQFRIGYNTLYRICPPNRRVVKGRVNSRLKFL